MKRWHAAFLSLMLFFVLGARAEDRLLQFLDKVWRVDSQGHVIPFSYPFPKGSLGISGFGSTGPLPSPDGRWIAFGRDSNLRLLYTPSSQERQISDYGRPQTGRFDSVEVLATAWSTDGSRLLFSVVPGGTECEDCEDLKVRSAPYGFYSFDPASGNVERLVLPKGFNFSAWLPDGRLIGTIPRPDTKPGQEKLLAFRPGEKQGSSIGAPSGSSGQLDVSSDGRWAVGYFDTRWKRPGTAQLVKIDLQEKSATPITPMFPWGENQQATFSPAAEHIAHVHLDKLLQGIPQETLMVDNNRLSSCSGSINYEWVNEHTVAIACQEELTILDVVTRLPISRYPLPAAVP